MSVNVGSAVAYLDLDATKFLSGITSSTSALGAFEQMTQQVTGSIDKIGTALTTTGTVLTTTLSVPILGAGAASVKMASDFESAMAKVKAISGATADEMERLTEKAVEMGALTKFSAKDSADAFTYMAMAGWDTEEMLAGIGGIMDLAAADGLDLATTSDIVTDALTAFGLQAQDTSHFVDVLAQASSSANTNVQMLGDSFRYVAPVAGALGFSVEDVALALGTMANSGIKGTQAGTSLRAALAAMTKPTDAAASIMEELGIEITNADGSMKSLMEIMEILRTSFADLTEAEKANAAATLFGRESMSAMLAIINASEEDFYSLADAIANSDGRAQEMAGTMMNNMGGAVEQLMGAIESFAILVGSALTPLITKVAAFLTTIVEKLNTLSDAQVEQLIKIAALVASIGPLVTVLGFLVSGFGTLITEGLKFLLTVGTPMVATFGLVTRAIGAIIAIIAGVVLAVKTAINIFKNLMETNEEFRTRVTAIWDKVKSVFNGAGESFKKFKEVIASVFKELNEKIDFSSLGLSIVSVIENIIYWCEEMQPVFEVVAEVIGTLLVGALYLAVEGFNFVIRAIEFMTERLSPLIENIGSFISIFASLKGALTSLFEGDFDSMLSYLSDITVEIKNMVLNVLESLVQPFIEFFQVVYAKIDEFFAAFPENFGLFLGQTFAKLEDFFSSILTWIIESFPVWFEAIEEFLRELPSRVWNWMLATVTKVKESGPLLKEAGKNIFEQLWEGLKVTWEAMKGWFEEVKQAIANFLSSITSGYNQAKTTAAASGIGIAGSHANGLAYVPYNGYVAELHQGERVLTKEENEDYSKGNNSSGDTYIFNSPEPIDEYQAARLFKQTKEELNRDF